MRISVKTKLFFTVLMVTILVISIIVAVTSWNLRQGFAAYVAKSELYRQETLISRLQTYYAAQNTWDAFKQDPERWSSLLQQTLHVEHAAASIAFPGFPTLLPEWMLTLTSNPAHAQSPSDYSTPFRPPRDDNGRDHPPPQSAYRDCSGKQEGEAVMHRTPEGLVSARCVYSPEGLFARPLRAPEPEQNQIRANQTNSQTIKQIVPPSLKPEAPAVAPATTPTESAAPASEIQARSEPPIIAPRNAPLTLAERLSLFDSQGLIVAGRVVQASDRLVHYSLKNDQRSIGSLGLLIPEQTTGLDSAFLEYSLYILIIAGVCAFLISIIITLALSHGFVHALKTLRMGTRQLAGGQFQTRIPGHRNDELGDLMKDFNRLANALEQHEESRRTWVSQTSHELRTPISVLRAHIEALIDGVRLTSKAELEVLHREVMRIGKLIADLNDLARADSGILAFRKEPVEFIALIEEMLGVFKDRFKSHLLTVEFDAKGRALVFADEDRMRQLLANLFENTLRYTDPPGKLRITYRISENELEVFFEDSAPDVATSNLADLFNPFFRTDASRRRSTGGSGLGLAICRSIVTAHEGRIQAEHSTLGGLKLTLTLPLMEA